MCVRWASGEMGDVVGGRMEARWQQRVVAFLSLKLYCGDALDAKCNAKCTGGFFFM